MADLTETARRALIERGFLPDFPAKVREEVQRITHNFSQNGPPKPEDGSQVRDLRNLPWFSVDNPDTRDLDQLSTADAGAARGGGPGARSATGGPSPGSRSTTRTPATSTSCPPPKRGTDAGRPASGSPSPTSPSWSLRDRPSTCPRGTTPPRSTPRA